jgi:hypothetical protein
MTGSLNGAPTKSGPSRQISSSSAPNRTRSVHVKAENARSAEVLNTQVTVQRHARLFSGSRAGFDALIRTPLSAGGPRNPQLKEGFSCAPTGPKKTSEEVTKESKPTNALRIVPAKCLPAVNEHLRGVRVVRFSMVTDCPKACEGFAVAALDASPGRFNCFQALFNTMSAMGRPPLLKLLRLAEG